RNKNAVMASGFDVTVGAEIRVSAESQHNVSAYSFKRFTGCGTAAGAGVTLGGTSTGAQLSLPLPFMPRRLCQGATTLSHSSRVPMIEIAIVNGITKYSTRNTSSVASSCSLPNCGSATSIAASNTPIEPGAWLAKPSKVARMNTTASDRKSMAGLTGIK